MANGSVLLKGSNMSILVSNLPKRPKEIGQRETGTVVEQNEKDEFIRGTTKR